LKNLSDQNSQQTKKVIPNTNKSQIKELFTIESNYKKDNDNNSVFKSSKRKVKNNVILIIENLLFNYAFLKVFKNLF